MHLPLIVALIIKSLFWLLAFAVLVRLAARRIGVVDANARRLLGAVALGALAGSKVVYLLGYPDLIDFSPVEASERLLAWIGGDSAVGGLLGGYIALWLVERSERRERLADALAAPIASALLVLSLGTFFWGLRGNGYGSPTSMPWGMNFGDGAMRHPVMLYEAAFLGAVVWLGRHRVFDAWQRGPARQFVAAYCAFNLVIGFLKPPFGTPLLREALEPPVRLYAELLTIEQWLCAVALGVVLRAWARAAKPAKEVPGREAG